MAGLLGDSPSIIGLLGRPNDMEGLLGRTRGRMANGRVVIEDEDGFHTELSATRPVPGVGWVNFPTIFGGQRLSEDDAFDIVQKSGFTDPETGRPLGVFGSQQDAVRAAIARSWSLNPQLDDVINSGPPSLARANKRSRRP